jgi:hypothetical protein
VAPNQQIIAAMVVHYHANGSLFVRISNGYHLKDLHDVYAPSPTNNQVLTWNNSNTRWEAAAAQQPNTFGTIAVSGQSNVVADSSSDTLTLVAGSNVTITTDAGTDAITINAITGGGGGSGASTFLEYNTPSSAGSTNTYILRFATAVKSVGTDVTYVSNSINGDTFKVNTAGRYMVSFQMRTNVTAYYGIKKSASISNSLTFNESDWYGAQNGATFGHCSFMIDCAVNDFIYFLSTSTSSTTSSRITITGPF